MGKKLIVINKQFNETYSNIKIEPQPMAFYEIKLSREYRKVQAKAK